MNALQTYTSPDGSAIRTLNIGGTPYFVAKDAAEALGYKDTINAIKQHCRGVVKHHPIQDSLGRTQEARVITEPDFYRLMVNSKLPNAQKFESWVFEEVLPAIRRTGGYMIDRPEETPEETMARALSIAADTLARREARIAQLEAEAHQTAQELAAADAVISTQHAELAQARPKAMFADAVANSDTCILIGELAKIICQNGYSIGQNRLFQWMRKNHYLTSFNRPTQRSMERGLFKLIERPIMNADGSTRVVFTTKVTGKGQQYFINHFLTH